MLAIECHVNNSKQFSLSMDISKHLVHFQLLSSALIYTPSRGSSLDAHWYNESILIY